MTTTAPPPERLSTPRERWAWLLLPLSLACSAIALLQLIAALAGAGAAVSAASDTAPVPLTLQAAAPLRSGDGVHFYSGTPYVADGTTVTATAVETEVSGIDPATRVALQLGPALQAAVACVAAAALGLALARIRRRGTRAERPLLVAAGVVAIGGVLAQVPAAWAHSRLGHVAWLGRDGVTGFTANTGTTIDLAPLAGAAGLLVLVLALRRARPA